MYNLGYFIGKLKKKVEKDGLVVTAHSVINKLYKFAYSKINSGRIENFISSINSKKTVYILMPIDWNHPLKQRPHHFAVELSKKGYTSVYLTPNNTYDNYHSIVNYGKGLFIVPFIDSVLDKIRNSVFMFSSTDPFVSIEAIEKIRKNQNYIIYDYIDEISSEISGSIDFMLKRHNHIKSNPDVIDLVTAVSLKLHNEMSPYFPQEKLVYLPNGCDFQHFHRTKRDPDSIPPKVKHIVEQNRAIVGYYGAMASWIDYDLINTIARELPEINILLIGPAYDNSVKNLLNLDNIHYIGPVSYTELPDYAVYFDVAMIPFKKGDIAKSTSPIKMYEYFALGKVVLYTEDLIECELYETPIKIDRNNLRKVIYEAIKLSKNEEYTLKILYEAKKNTWKSRIEKLHSFLELSFR